MGGSIPVIQTAGANRVLTDLPRVLFESGRYNKVPVMYIILKQLISSLKLLINTLCFIFRIGTNKDEGSFPLNSIKI